MDGNSKKKQTAVQSDEPYGDNSNPRPKHTVRASGHFDAAHFLALYPGKCKNIHGHRFSVTAAVSGNLKPDGASRGMVVDFGDLKHVLGAICDTFDHTLIFEKGTLSETLHQALTNEGFALSEVSFRPTAENFAKFIYDEISNSDLCKNCAVQSVTVYETPDNSAAYGY